MGNRIEKADAQRALGGIIRREVEDAADGNRLVSMDEARELGPFLQKAEAEVRSEKAPYARVRVDEVIDRAMQNAMGVWGRFNPPDNKLDARYLSRAEVQQVGEVDHDLGRLSQAAYASARGPNAAGGRDRARMAAIERFLGQGGVGELLARTSSFGREVDARPGSPMRRDLPAGVLRGFDAYHPAEQADFASVTLKEVRLGGERLWSVHMRTDGDDGYVELFDRKGAPLVSARLTDNDLERLDPFFGLGRHAGTHGRLNAPHEEGYSEDPERLEHGQILSTWQPEVVIEGGRIEHDGAAPTRFETPADLTREQAELARFAIELAYPRSLQFRADGPGPIDLARNAAIAIGEHVDPRDGTRYLVADYRDIDDDSHTFYFTRGRYGDLDLARAQYNN